MTHPIVLTVFFSPISLVPDVTLRWKARNQQIPGLTFDEQGSWQGPYFFVFGADTQLGLIDQMNNVTVNAGRFLNAATCFRKRACPLSSQNGTVRE